MTSLLMILILLLMLIPIASDAVDPFTVRVIYFKPLDASPVPVGRITQLMQETQEFYASEMDRIGFGKKTFDIETLDNDIVIHAVNGVHDADHYFQNTYEQMVKEIPREFTSAQDNVNVFIVGGLDLVYGGALGVGWTISGWRAGGGAVLPGDRLNVPIIAHEIGHAFGLFHNDVTHTMMGLYDGRILDYEARWLNKSHYFNDKHIRSDIPKFVANLGITPIKTLRLKFRFAVKSDSGLYASKIIRIRGGLVIGTNNLSEKEEISEIDVLRPKLVTGDNISIRVIDINGNYIFHDISNITLPAVVNPTPRPKKNPDLEPEVDTKPEENQDDNLEEQEEIEEQCPGCRVDQEDNDSNLNVANEIFLTTQWATIKARR